MYSTDLFEHIEKQRTESREIERLRMLKKTKAVLKTYFSSKPVLQLYITGSLVQPHRFHTNSDIDIAVLGLRGELFFKSISELEELLGYPVEIIELENCRFSEKIIYSGIRII